MYSINQIKHIIEMSQIENEERICRNCGCDCTEMGGWYHELGEYGLGDEYHCVDCHDELYTEEEWLELCEEDSDEYYYTE